MGDRREIEAVFVLGLRPSRRLRFHWAGLVRDVRQTAMRHGVWLRARRWSYKEADRTLPPGVAMMVGHSFGGWRCVQLAQQLADAGRDLEHLVLLDPVPLRGWGILDRTSFRLPPNVRNATCFLRWRPWGMPPFSQPIRRSAGRFVNRRAGLSHDGVAGHPRVRRHVREVVEALAAR